MNDILFGNNNTEVIKRLSKRYFKKNRIRNLAAILAIMLTAFLFTSITSLVFSMSSSVQLSMQMQKGSKADGDIRYLTEEQYEELQNSDFIKEAGCRRFVGFASNASGHMVEINYADPVQQELTFCTPTHGKAPKKANEIATTDQALEALGVEAKVGETVPVEFTLRGETYQYEMVVSGWWEAANDTGSLLIVSEQFVKDNPEIFVNTYAEDREIAGTYMADVVLKDKRHIQKQLQEFARSVGGEPEQMNADNYIACSQNQVGNAMLQPGMMLSAVVFVLLFVVSGYLLIYNIFRHFRDAGCKTIRSASDNRNVHKADQKDCEPAGTLADADRSSAGITLWISGKQDASSGCDEVFPGKCFECHASVRVSAYLSDCSGIYNFYRNDQYTETGKKGGADIPSGSHPLYRAGKEENERDKTDTWNKAVLYGIFQSWQEQTEIRFYCPIHAVVHCFI